ncbi:MAG: preprotein translocase subunit YajC [Thermonemataceae bacterium]|nr:preprotein translocase subunit YajC [Thermonemataceae bacterium]
MITTILLQTQTANSQQGGGSWMSILFMLGIFVVFYFFMIKPQQKKQKDQVKYRDSVKKGDKVVTIGGLHGKVVEINNDSFVLEVDKGVKLTFEKTSISMEGSKRFAAENASNA